MGTADYRQEAEIFWYAWLLEICTFHKEFHFADKGENLPVFGRGCFATRICEVPPKLIGIGKLLERFTGQPSQTRMEGGTST